jgi:ubiquinone/menaquinone biosynthesis C-methylase UbiE
MVSYTAVETREAAHWDSVAQSVGDEALMVLPEATATVDRRHLALMGNLTGRRVLDVGCGEGLWTARLAAAGAHVDSIDISPGMVDVTRRRAKLLGFGKRVDARVMSAMRLEYPDATFDAVHGRDIIHHLDPGEFGKEIARVLKPGGVAVFRENNGTNGLLMLARNTLCGRFGIAKWSSDDEYPLTPARRRAFGSHFDTVKVEYPEFVMFHYIDAKFFKYRVKAMSIAMKALDRFAGTIPYVRRFSYRQLIAATR